MIKESRNLSRSKLCILFRLMPEAERATALNLRSHNPLDVKMVTEVQIYVDEALGIKGDAFFKSDDEIRLAALKGIRNVLAGRAKNKWVSRWFFSAADGHALESLRVYLEGLYASPKIRFLRTIGLPKFLLMIFLLLAKRLKHMAGVMKGPVLRCRDFLARGFLPDGGRLREEPAPDRARTKPPTVLVVTSLYHQIVNFTVRRVVDELEQKKAKVILAFHDGFVYTKPRSTENGSWWSHMTSVALKSDRGTFSSWAALVATPPLLFSAIGSIAFAIKRIVKAPSGDWGARWILLRKVPVLIACFHVRLSQAEGLLSRLQPNSVFNCDNGSENNLYVKAFAYACLIMGVPFYRYKPVPFFPVRQAAFNSVSRFMLAIPEDAEIYKDNGAVPDFWHVGSPILDLAAPFVSNNARATAERDGDEREEIRILFFTKRDFPNHGVISAVSGYCEENRLPVKLIVKFHPSDAKQFDSSQSIFNGLVRVVYYGKEEIEQVDRLIFESDIVISGSSNVIWSAFAQFKPVLYLAFRGMSSKEHLSGYRRYATSDFIVVSQLDEIGSAVGDLIKRARAGKIAKDSARHDSLMRNFFCSGEFNSTDRICRILLGDAWPNH